MEWKRLHGCYRECSWKVFRDVSAQFGAENSMILATKHSANPQLHSSENEIKRWDSTTNEKKFLERRTNKKIKCETEPVKSFHRRDNARTFGLSQKTEASGTLSEPSETSMRNLVDNANLISASITANDIYIAHSHLHYMGCQRSRVGTESMVVIFVGRIGKINLLKNKKELAKNWKINTWMNLKIYQPSQWIFLFWWKATKDRERIDQKEGALLPTQRGGLSAQSTQSVRRWSNTTRWTLKSLLQLFIATTGDSM